MTCWGNSEEVTCPRCNKIFYLKSFRLQEAKSITCMFCNRRFNIGEKDGN